MSDRRANSDNEGTGGYPPVRQSWYAVGVLCFAYALVSVDRQIVVFLVDPIRADLAISDFEFSLINGFAFAVLYSLAGIPLGRFADSHNRRDIIAVAIAFWSLTTVLCSRASGFTLLLVARLGVGVSNAALVPASVSLIADSFSPERRPLAINIHASGAYIGIGLAHVFSGFIVSAATTAQGLVLPLSGSFSPWQLAFVFIALPSIVVLALMRRLNEPARYGRRVGVRATQLQDTFAYLSGRWFVYVSLIVGAAFSAVGVFAVYAWVPTLFARVYDWSSTDIGLVFGFVTIVFGTAGLVVSGNYARQFVSEGQKFVFQRLMMLSVACAIIPAAITLTADTALGMWACIAAVIFFLAMPFGLAQTAIQAITPPDMRAQLIAVYIAALNLIGLSLGSIAVAMVSDFVFRDVTAVHRSLGIVIVGSGVASVLLLALGVKQYEEMGREAGNE
ncbi:MAG: MFS transporter [Gammaproteobacteria bacterium]